MRYLARFALPFSGAVLLSCYLPQGRLVWAAVLLCAAVLTVSLICARFRRTAILLTLCGALAGFLWFGGYAGAVNHRMAACDGVASAFTAEVASFPSETDYGVSLTLRLKSGAAAGNRVLVYLEPSYAGLKPGDTVVGTGTYSGVGTARDGENSYYASRGIYLTADVEVASCYRAPSVPLRYLPQRLAQGLRLAVERLFTGEERGMLLALLTGEKSGVSDSLYHDFCRSGTAHLMAVSGLHVGFLTGILYLLPGNRRRRGLVGIPVLVCFALLTGAQPSICRAVVMASLVLLAPIFYRESDGITSLSFALFLLLLYNPFSARSAGLQLSFAAAAGLILIQPRLYRWLLRPVEGRRAKHVLGRMALRLYRELTGSVTTSCAALVFTLPLAACYFGMVSLVSPLTNLVSIWAAGVCFGLGLIACVLWWMVPAGAAVLAIPVRWLLRLLIWIARGVSRWPFAALTLDNLYYQAWFAYLVLMILLVLALRPLRKRPVLPLCSTAALLFLALWLRIAGFGVSPLTVTALDVGQGSCTVLSSHTTFGAVDCGGSAAGERLADFITQAGGEELSLLVLTHYDEDHIDGVEALVERVPVAALVLPDIEDASGSRMELTRLAREHEIQLLWAEESLTAEFGDGNLTVFPPLSTETDNAASLSVLAEWEDRHVLITGDLPQEQEAELLERVQLPKLDVLVAGHHGSSTSTGERLLTCLRPDITLISVGDNGYGLPGEDTLLRVSRYHSTIYRTDENGTVTIHFYE